MYLVLESLTQFGLCELTDYFTERFKTVDYITRKRDAVLNIEVQFRRRLMKMIFGLVPVMFTL